MRKTKETNRNRQEAATIYHILGSEVLTEVTMKITVFWVLTPVVKRKPSVLVEYIASIFMVEY
jgi:hypothetical protein